MAVTRLVLLAALGTACALAAAGAALADNYRYDFVARDQAAARRAVLLRSDIPTLAGWAGGHVKPDESAQTDQDRCNGVLPKQSDLVVTGDSETKYSRQGFTLDTQATVFRSAAMVETDWSRQPRPPAMLHCLRAAWAGFGPKGSRLVSARIRSVSGVGTHGLGFEVVWSQPTGVGTQRVEVAMEMVGFSRGRIEVALVASSPVASSRDVGIVRAVAEQVSRIVDGKLLRGAS